MNTVTLWLERSRDWLDERGRPAWIAAMVVGFILFWPIGLALLFYTIWSKRMCSHSWKSRRMSCRSGHRGFEKTGNTAFDAYREETLKRLEEERDAFVSFLEELRSAKDRAEFDQFMSSRRTGTGEVVA
ncbi:MAG: DUF2852 domain-containing protein [Rhodobacteraceae bacterium]|uniref:DUF2852 domain-containing protein n=1 Tax=Amaricoccus sp. B4 TaxID=3368557 RepID=UPI000DAD4B82|nr:DUF2852 domain-containing protein [Paracoccaceae bacterium]